MTTAVPGRRTRDDTDSAIAYSGTGWVHVINASEEYYGHSYVVSQNPGDQLRVSMQSAFSMSLRTS